MKQKTLIAIIITSLFVFNANAHDYDDYNNSNQPTNTSINSTINPTANINVNPNLQLTTTLGNTLNNTLNNNLTNNNTLNNALSSNSSSNALSNSNSLSNANANSNAISNNSNTNNNQSNATNTSNSTNNNSSSSNGGSNANNVNISNNTTYKQAKIPVASAIAPLNIPTATCMGSSSAGIQSTALGVSFGSSWRDDNCMTIEQVKTVINVLNDYETAEELMCNIENYRKARKLNNRPCLIDLEKESKK